MKVKDLAEKTGWQLYADEAGRENEINGAFVGDLLSWVMGHSAPQQAWITVQAHVNVVAVAVLREFACLIVCQDSKLTAELIQQAAAEKLPVFTTSLSAFETCRKLIELGV